MDTTDDKLSVLRPDGAKQDGETGIPDVDKKPEAPDVSKAFIHIDGEGWLTAKVHIARGLYPILGFLREVEDHLRIAYANIAHNRQEAEKKKDLIKPKGFRGFNWMTKKD